MTDTDDTRLGQQFGRLREGHEDESGFMLLGQGTDAFLARALLAQAAERSIDAQYYLLHDDLTGRLFIDQLIRAADRGVRVRLLVDDMDLEGRDLGARVLDSHPNIEVRLFNPFSRDGSRLVQMLTRFGSVTRRMHNKSFTVDSQVTILGGRNIGDEYFEADPAMRFKDLDVLATGNVAGEVARSFDSYWNHRLSYPVATLYPAEPGAGKLALLNRRLADFVASQRDGVYLRSLREAPLAQSLRSGELDLRWGKATVVVDHPDKLVSDRAATQYHLATALQPVFAGIEQELLIFSPYFVPGREGTDFLVDLARRGVRVKILTNSLASTDVAVVHAGYAKYRKQLLRAGIELFETKPNDGADANDGARRTITGSSRASLHAKSFVVDRDTLFIGSLNLDPRSFVENSEIGVLLEDPATSAEMSDWFDQNVPLEAYRLVLETTPDGHEAIRWIDGPGDDTQVFDHDPGTGWAQRLLVGIASLLPIESQL